MFSEDKNSRVPKHKSTTVEILNESVEQVWSIDRTEDIKFEKRIQTHLFSYNFDTNNKCV